MYNPNNRLQKAKAFFLKNKVLCLVAGGILLLTNINFLGLSAIASLIYVAVGLIKGTIPAPVKGQASAEKVIHYANGQRNNTWNSTAQRVNADTGDKDAPEEENEEEMDLTNESSPEDNRSEPEDIFAPFLNESVVPPWEWLQTEHGYAVLKDASGMQYTLYYDPDTMEVLSIEPVVDKPVAATINADLPSEPTEKIAIAWIRDNEDALEAIFLSGEEDVNSSLDEASLPEDPSVWPYICSTLEKMYEGRKVIKSGNSLIISER